MQFEYKTVLLEIDRTLWRRALDDSSVDRVQATLDKLGRDGWELVSVWPITDGRSPPQIDHAIHYFKRPVASHPMAEASAILATSPGKTKDSYDKILAQLKEAGIEVATDGEQSEAAIESLETLLGRPLPRSYREFVQAYGFAGPEYNPYRGIVNNDPATEAGESAYFQTLLLRKSWDLPDQYLVVWYEYDLDMATCIDLAKPTSDGECLIVQIERDDRNHLDITTEANNFFTAFQTHMSDLIESQ